MMEAGGGGITLGGRVVAIAGSGEPVGAPAPDCGIFDNGARGKLAGGACVVPGKGDAAVAAIEDEGSVFAPDDGGAEAGSCVGFRGGGAIAGITMTGGGTRGDALVFGATASAALAAGTAGFGISGDGNLGAAVGEVALPFVLSGISGSAPAKALVWLVSNRVGGAPLVICATGLGGTDPK